MKLRYILIMAMLIAAISCSKSNNGGNPTVKIKSLSPGVVGRNDAFIVDLGFTEGDGAIIDSIFIVMHRLNLNQAGTVNEFVSFSYTVPSYPGLSKGDFQLSFIRNLNGPPNYAYLPDPVTAQNDTVRFSFYVRDVKNHTSDTATATSNVIILAD